MSDTTVAKKVHFVIYQDSTGTELCRKIRTVGRPSYGSYTDADKNTVVPNCSKDANGNLVIPKAPVKSQEPKVQHYYIDLNEDGTQASKRPIGPGKRGKGYVKNADGDYVRTIKSASMKDTVTK